MPSIKICPLPDGAIGPLGGPFAVECYEPETEGPVVSSVIQFSLWVSRGMSSYRNKGGVEDSSLFKSFTTECFDELTREVPEVAAHLTDLVVICNELPAELNEDHMWRLHRAILATLPRVRFIE